MKPKKIAYDTFVILAISIAILTAIEMALRVTFPDLKNTRTPLESLAYQHNNDYLVSLKPNITKTYTAKKEENNFGETVTWRTNSSGFRGEEINQESELRVIVYGDSNVQARFSEDKDTYPVVLQKLLRNNYANAEVINAGLVGAGPDQNLIRLSMDASKIKPDIVIFHVFADNDYGDIIKNRLYMLSGKGELIRTGLPISVDKKFTSREPSITTWAHKLFIQRIINKLVTQAKDYNESTLSRETRVERTLNDLERRSKAEYEVYAEGGPRKFSHFDDHYDIDIAADPDFQSSRVKITLMKTILVAAQEFCTANNIIFVVLVQPSIFDLTLNDNYGGYADLANKYKSYKPTNLTDPLKEVCKNHNMNCIHLIDNYKRNNPDTLYMHDGHWNTKGQQIAAEETAKMITQLSGSSYQR